MEIMVEEQRPRPKQVIVMLKFPSMPTGKYIAQASHAILGAVLKGGQVQAHSEGLRTFAIPLDDELEAWLTGQFTKITLQVSTTEELLAIHAEAEKAGLRSALIKDAGHTIFKGVPTYTCLAIGPHLPEKIDPITGHLKMF